MGRTVFAAPKGKTMSKFTVLMKGGRARRGVLHTVHGDVQTPVFMNVGTCAAIKGGVSTVELEEIDCQVELSRAESRLFRKVLVMRHSISVRLVRLLFVAGRILII